MGRKYSCWDVPSKNKPFGNPDISGIGVVLGFLIMGWMSIGLLVVYYLSAFNPNIDPFRKTLNPAKAQIARENANPVDRAFLLNLPFAKRFRRPDNETRIKTELLLAKCIMSLADAQLLAGLAVLISGWYTLTTGLEAYHWQVITYLTWFSCLTHLSALTFLRTRVYNPMAARIWRLVLMTILVIFLLVALVPTGHFEFTFPVKDGDYFYKGWYDAGVRIVRPTADSWDTVVDEHPDWILVLAQSPAGCFFKSGFRQVAGPTMIFSMLLLIYGFTVRVCKLFEASSRKFWGILHGGIHNAFDKIVTAWGRRLQWFSSSKGLLLGSISLPVLSAVYCSLRIAIDLYSSMLMEVLTLVVSAIWGTIRLVEYRKTMESQYEHKEDNKWGFGQVVPLILILAPLLPTFELAFNSISNSSSPLDSLGYSGVVQSAQQVDDGHDLNTPSNDNFNDDQALYSLTQNAQPNPVDEPLPTHFSNGSMVEMNGTSYGGTSEANFLGNGLRTYFAPRATGHLRSMILDCKNSYNETTVISVLPIPVITMLAYSTVILVSGLKLFVAKPDRYIFIDQSKGRLAAALISILVYTPALICCGLILLGWVIRAVEGKLGKAVGGLVVYSVILVYPVWTMVSLLGEEIRGSSFYFGDTDNFGRNYVTGISVICASMGVHCLIAFVWWLRRVMGARQMTEEGRSSHATLRGS